MYFQFQLPLHKSVCIRSYSGPHFPAFACRKIQTSITPNTDAFHAVQWFELKWNEPKLCSPLKKVISKVVFGKFSLFIYYLQLASQTIYFSNFSYFMPELSLLVKMNSSAAINVEKSMFHTFRWLRFVLQDACVQNALLSYQSCVLGPICRVMGPHRLLDSHKVIIFRGAFSKVIIASGNIITFFTGTRYVQSQQWKQKNNAQAKFRPQQKHLKWSLKDKNL